MKTINELKELKRTDDEIVGSLRQLLPARYQDVELENCPQFIQDYTLGKKDGKGMYLFGPVGTGKTYALYAIYLTARANQQRAQVANTAELLADIREDYRLQAKDPYYQPRFDYWMKYEGILFLDDFGAEKVTDWALETLYLLINQRYENKLYTVFTSNYDLKRLQERVGARIPSRIAEMCLLAELSGKDKRI